MTRVVTFSSGIAEKAELKVMLDIDEMLLRPADNVGAEYVVGWGRKPNTQQARDYADKNQLEYNSLEDGFLHSMGQGVLGAKSCSLVKDSTGIYYDATQASDLETLIYKRDKTLFSEGVIKRAELAIQRITQNHIAKYNNASLSLDNTIFFADQVVLVIDQTAGDMSLKYGHVNDKTFDEMLQAALDDYPKAQIIVKTHPDVIVGKKKSSIDLTKLPPRVTVISDSVNPLVLLKSVDVVYVATSQMGFEALMLGKLVVCFGVPFYAGWGLTQDRADKALDVWTRRKKERTLEELFAAAYIHYPRYMNPDSNTLCDLEGLLSYFEKQLSHRLDSSTPVLCFNFTRWKRNYIKVFLANHSNIAFVSSKKQAEVKGFNGESQLISWASKKQHEVVKTSRKWGGVPWFMEDGFIRSTGLGTDLTAPASLVLDKTGIYYDPTAPSDLEIILRSKQFSADEKKRAGQLRSALLENELSKYNLGSQFDPLIIKSEDGQKIILIPGQVEGDASIEKGCVDIKTNADLIKESRANEPHAYLIYKPHPDVVSGNRQGAVSKVITDAHCDLLLLDASITDCLAVVDEVHTMTSLVGFEGLMRELKVVCYGLPFYSNWGLTQDRHLLERRTRKLELDELVHGTLIDYPLYINWKTGDFTTPEVVVQQLKEQIDQQGGKQSNQVFWLRRQLRKLKNIFSGIAFNRR